MSKFRDESTIETVYHGCPICNSDVKGNDVYNYFCSKCNILFRKMDLVITKEAVEKILKEKIVEKFKTNSDAIKIEDKTFEEKELSDKQKDLLNNRISVKKPEDKKTNPKKTKSKNKSTKKKTKVNK